MRVLRDIFIARPWWELAPDQRLIVSQTVEGTTLNTAARSSSGHWIMAYLSSPSTVSIDMSKITAGSRALATWIDPTNGIETVIGYCQSSGVHSFTTPDGWVDALLWIEAIG
jgi:Putative collagen-binding domain of a collagenase